MPTTEKTKAELALDSATEYFGSANNIPECLDRFEKEYRMFRPISADGSEGELMECADYLSDMADTAWEMTIELRNAGLHALSELAKLYDLTLRGVVRNGPKAVKDARAALVRFTNDATKELDLAEDAMVVGK